ncbi:hypothetical protein XTPLMG730_0918 [Xanthomonas translucens pv. phlei]|uniref:AlgX/AlgJ SGNH hydrolase-like domain-containing protein n=1 Tax=Xanthomonas graminis pv. phlei TaxID=487906 RepID=A0A0K2ZKR7_9XANT|nr:hypothetical protein XTPLMG730_0918 [Xanthomonas translucens pv. phlei]
MRARALWLGLLCAFAAVPALAQVPVPAPAPTAAAAAAQDSSIVLVGKDGWLFPAWGSLTEVDGAAIERNTASIAEARTALAAAGVELEVLVLPDKALF